MLFTQTKARRSTGTKLAPLGSRTFAPQPQQQASCRQYKPASQQQLSSKLSTVRGIHSSREYAELCPQSPISLHATHETGQWRMMRDGDERPSPEPTWIRHFGFSAAAHCADFSFEPLSLPEMHLTFPPRPPPGPRKRSRATTDIDGEHSCMQKKKRRLRLLLITSRLSPQFSHPATNIVDRGSSKIAVWAKQKSLGRNLLRKAAILNRIRRRAVFSKEVTTGQGRSLVEQEREQEELKLARLEFDYGSVDTYTRPVSSQNPSVPPAAAVRSGGRFVVSGSPTGSPTSSRSPSPTPSSPPPKDTHEESTSAYRSPNEAYALSPPRIQLPRKEYIPLPPSPLGLSNYDAFDVDEDIPDPYSHLDDDDDNDEEQLSTNLFDDDDEADSVPFSPSAVTSTSSSTIQTRTSQMLQTPLPTMPSALDFLDHDEAVFGDYDQVDDGADSIWPSSHMQKATAPTTGSTSPDFHALFATAPSKRADSFASPSNFRPTKPLTSVSPNFPPTQPTASASLTSTSPNFPPSTTAPPTFTAAPMSPNLTTLPVSPNFLAADEPTPNPHFFAQRRMSVPSMQRPDDDRTRRNSDIDQERKRQRDLMFARFRS